MLSSIDRSVRDLEARAVHSLNRRLGKLSPTLHIYGVHLRRLGLLRITTGAHAQYLAIPVFLFTHGSVWLTRDKVLRPLLGLPALDWDKYLVFDRHAMPELGYLDRFNCTYCGWANGVAALFEHELDAIEQCAPIATEALSPGVRAYLASSVVAQAAVMAYLAGLWELVVAPLLGMHRTPLQEVVRAVREAGYGERWSPGARAMLRFYKIYARYQLNALEQIESAWCPLKHAAEGNFPAHHADFFSQDDVAEMLRFLEERGTTVGRLRSQRAAAATPETPAAKTNGACAKAPITRP